MDTTIMIITFIVFYGFAVYHNVTTPKRTVD